MDDLITWLRAQLDAHERGICPDPGDCQRMFHTADENFALDDIAAKRELIGEILNYAAWIDGEKGCCHSAEAIGAGECPDIQPIQLWGIKLLALPYAARPGCRVEWKPMKTPAQCKWCAARCVCSCHAQAAPIQPESDQERTAVPTDTPGPSTPAQEAL